MNTRSSSAALWLVVAIVAWVSSGCSTLLPAAKQEVVSDWTSYEDALNSLAAIEAHPLVA